MNKQENVQQLKSERVQQPALRKALRPTEAGFRPAPTPVQAQQRLKAERVQSRLRRLPGWKIQSGGKAIDRVRQFRDPQVAASYLAYAALLASQSGQPLQAVVNGQTVILVLPGRSMRPGAGITEDVLELAEQLG
jgi:pterin-4a-carbinolamine dehydratase